MNEGSSKIPCVLDVGAAHARGYAAGSAAARLAFDPPSESAVARFLGGSIPRADMPELVGLKRGERRAKLRGLHGEVAQLDAQLAKLADEKDYLGRLLAAADEAISWAQGQLTLQKPHGSVLHHLMDEIERDRVLYADSASKGSTADKELRRTYRPLVTRTLQDAQSFVIEHDWASAFASVTEFADGEFRLPHERCFFEFRISGREAVVIACQEGDDPDTIKLHPAVRTKAGWLFGEWEYRQSARAWIADSKREVDDAWGGFAALIGSQIKAVSVALEAEIAHSEIVRAPYRLNRARERSGRTLLSDYHVVCLARRPRALPADDAQASERRHPRLHFRRAHWRHYDNHKTWIKWTLVGDPDLGFIDKHYRL